MWYKNAIAIVGKKYAVKDVVAGVEYEFRVIAINLSGPSEPSHASPFVIARDPKSKAHRVLTYLLIINYPVFETKYSVFLS